MKELNTLHSEKKLKNHRKKRSTPQQYVSVTYYTNTHRDLVAQKLHFSWFKEMNQDGIEKKGERQKLIL